jgi:hypothetical protein
MRDERGRFLPGPDRDRHRLTRAERRRGYRNGLATTADNVHVYAWLFRRVRRYYSIQRRAG